MILTYSGLSIIFFILFIFPALATNAKEQIITNFDDWTKEVDAVPGLNNVVVGKYSTAGHIDKYKTVASRTPLYGYEEVLMSDTLHTATKANTKINK